MQKNIYEFPMSPLLRELVYGSYLRTKNFLHGKDVNTRTIGVTDQLLQTLSITFSQWPRVTVTGSKGKGSTAVLLAGILSASGEKVGLITSPHLRRFNERIRIDGKCVSDEELEEAAKEIKSAVRSLVAKLHPQEYLGPGGVVLALAAKIFIKHQVTALVVEAGRGGAYDESRLVQADISLITPIMLKHVAAIGPHLSDIARTKTLITFPGSMIITAQQKPGVLNVIKATAEELSSPVLEVGKSVRIIRKRETIESVVCDLQVNGDNYNNLSLSLAGSYQVENAAAAILAARELTKFGAKCTTEGIYKGVSQVRWPGRCQLLQKNPWIFLDGAINKTSTKYLKKIIKQIPAKRFTVVVAIHREKDLAGACSVLASDVDSIILTEVHTDVLGWNRSVLLKSASQYFTDLTYIPNVNDAFTFVKKNIKKNEGVLLLGHQSFVGSALSFWNSDTCRLW